MPDIDFSRSATVPYMFIHEVTGTYLLPDSWDDGIGEAVQTWNENPPRTKKGQIGHLWYVESTSTQDVGLIKSYENGRCLTAGSKASDLPRLRVPDQSRLQEWIIRRVHGSDTVAHDADSYALIPRAYPDYALAPKGNVVSNNVYVIPMSMWGGPPSISQYWKAVPVTDKPGG